MDCFKHQLIFFVEQFVAAGDVEIAFAAHQSAPWSFIVRKAPLDWSRVTSYKPSAAKCGGATVSKLLHAAADRLAADYHVDAASVATLHGRLEKAYGCVARG